MASANGFIDFKENVPTELEKTSNTLFVPTRRKPWGGIYITREDTKIAWVPSMSSIIWWQDRADSLMAGLILEKYQQGERNFIFFVNNENILTKTRDNFLTAGASKYLFAKKIVLNNQVIPVREVTDFLIVIQMRLTLSLRLFKSSTKIWTRREKKSLVLWAVRRYFSCVISWRSPPS